MQALPESSRVLSSFYESKKRLTMRWRLCLSWFQSFRFFLSITVSVSRSGLWLYAEMSVHGCDQSVRFIDLYNVHSLHSQFACCRDPARSRSFVDQWPNRGNRYLFDPSKLFQLYVTQGYNNLFSLIKNGRRQNTKWKGNSILKVEKIEFVISSLKFQS